MAYFIKSDTVFSSKKVPFVQANGLQLATNEVLTKTSLFNHELLNWARRRINNITPYLPWEILKIWILPANRWDCNNAMEGTSSVKYIHHSAVVPFNMAVKFDPRSTASL